MPRVNISYTDPDTQETVTGWFDPSSGDSFEEGTEWDGNNHIGVCSGIQASVGGETLWRTAKGRWVLNRDARSYFNGPNAYRFLTDAEAKEWLVRSEVNDEALEKYFGGLEDEAGPGRPKIGPPISLAFPEKMIADVDARAQELSISRAELVRRYVADGLAAPR